MQKEIIKNRNLEATIEETTHNGIFVLINQVGVAGGEYYRDLFHSKFGFKSFESAKKWAVKEINQ